MYVERILQRCKTKIQLLGLIYEVLCDVGPAFTPASKPHL